MDNLDQDYKLLYYKYKTKYINMKKRLELTDKNFKTNMIQMVGGVQDCFIQYINNDKPIIYGDNIELIQNEIMKILKQKYLFDKSRIDYTYDDSHIISSISHFFKNQYIDYISHILLNNQKNLKKEIEDLLKMHGSIDLKNLYTNLLISIDHYNSDKTPKNKKKLLDELQKYKIAEYVITKFDDVFVRLIKIQDQKIGERNEENINSKIIQKLATLNAPILYMTNIQYQLLDPIIENNQGKFKKEIDSVIFVKNAENVWVPVVIIESKNNMNLVLDDIYNYNALLLKLDVLDGNREMNVKNKDTNENETVNINLSNFRNCKGLYCINNIQLSNEKFLFINSQLIQREIGFMIQTIIKSCNNNEMFTTYKKLNKHLKNCLNNRAVKTDTSEIDNVNLIKTTIIKELPLLQLKFTDSKLPVNKENISKLELKMNQESTIEVDTTDIISVPENINISKKPVDKLIRKEINSFQMFINLDRIDILHMCS